MDRTSKGNVPADMDQIKSEEWTLVDQGADVHDSEGERIGTVRESMPSYLLIKVKLNLLSDVEMYIPRELVQHVTSEKVHLNITKDSLESRDLTTPPAEK